jgi:hypothetical protein
MSNYICWFSRIVLLGILIFKGLSARRLYKSFDVKGLKCHLPYYYFSTFLEVSPRYFFTALG